jgi:hypothetical protein
MKLWIAASTALVCLALLTGFAQATPFDFPPEEHAPNWLTTFPPEYQRNILWTFETDPRGGPTPTGAPGAHYQGVWDPWLWGSDYVELTGDVTWVDQPGIFFPNSQGLVGIINTDTQNPKSGSVIFHLDNSPWPFNEKFLWAEAEFIASPNADVQFELVPGPGTDYTIDFALIGAPRPTGPENDYFVWQNAWAEIVPNPLWEDLIVNITLPPAENPLAPELVYFDTIHFATECTPEPSSLMLCVLAAVGVGLTVFRLPRKSARG